MPRSPSVHEVPLPPRTVAGLLRDRRTTVPSASGPPLRRGAVIRSVQGWAVRVTRAGVDGIEMRAAGPHLSWTRTVRLTATSIGTQIRVEFDWRAAGVDEAAATRAALHEQHSWSAALAELVAAAPGWPVVVAAAMLRDGQVLVAQRADPPALAGRWELPGGRVEVGESEVGAVRRELAEELSVDVEVVDRLGTDVLLDLPRGRALLRVHHGFLRGPAEPVALEHSDLAWVGPDQLADLDWVPADTAVLDDLVTLLRT